MIEYGIKIVAFIVMYEVLLNPEWTLWVYATGLYALIITTTRTGLLLMAVLFMNYTCGIEVLKLPTAYLSIIGLGLVGMLILDINTRFD